MISLVKRVALFIPNLTGGGVERSFVNLATGFSNAGYHVDLLLKHKTGEYLEQIPQDIQVVDLGSSRMIGTLPKIRVYLRKQKPLALIAGLDLANMIAILSRQVAMCPVKTIVTIHTVVSAYGNYFLPNRNLERLTMRIIYPRATQIVAVSHAVAKDFSEFTAVNLSRIKVIYNPTLSNEFYQKASQSIESTWRAYPWFQPGQPPVVLAVGRLDQVKDFPTLIRAFHRIRQIRPAHLLILGEGPQRSELETLIKDFSLEEDAQLPGFAQNPHAYMKRAAVFALSSLHEASPNVLTEALACGCQVVSTNCPGGAAELIGNGLYGRLVPVGDDRALAEAILSVLNGDHRPAPEDWLNNFVAEKSIARYISLVEGEEE